VKYGNRNHTSDNNCCTFALFSGSVLHIQAKNFENVGVMPVDCTQVLNLGWWEQRMDIPFEMESDYVQVG